MPSEIVIVNGHRVQRAPGAPDLDLGPVQADAGSFAAEHPTLHRIAAAVGNASPEIAGGVAALLGPETGGLSLAIPPLVAGATEAGREYFNGEDLDPAKIMLRGGLNAIPGVVGKIAGRFMGGGTRALEAMSEGGGSNMLQTAAKGAHAMVADPVAEAAGTNAMARSSTGATRQLQMLMQKLQDPTLNAQAKAAVVTAIRRLQAARSTSVAQSLRGILGLGEAYSGDDQ